jgi:hypothetical protein
MSGLHIQGGILPSSRKVFFTVGEQSVGENVHIKTGREGNFMRTEKFTQQ